MGLVMQVLVIAVQNAVDYRDLGVATSGNSLFRSIGGSVGTAVLGAIFASRLTAELAAHPTAGGGAGLSLQAMAQLPPEVRATYAQAFTSSIDTVFAVATVIALLGFLTTWLLPERPLRETVSATSADVGQEVAGAMAMPAAPDSYEELVRGLSAVVGRDVRRSHVERIVARAGVALDAHAGVPLGELARRAPYDADMLHRAADSLKSAGLVVDRSADVSAGFDLTPMGCETLERIVSARRAHLEELFGQWTAEEREELASLIRRVSHELVPDVRTTGEHVAVRDAVPRAAPG
jgi:DNA-binding MarR family transcriptional regulator